MANEPDSAPIVHKCEKERSSDNDSSTINDNNNTYYKFSAIVSAEAKSQNSQVPIILNNTMSSKSLNTTNSGCSNSAKMGSRRIFTPQFKLQVLESYRHDSDCKGNQRATARKYNIHRRQIQKWLQCELNLRSSVANINQNNVKHHFHNVTHHHHHQQQQQLQMQSVKTSLPTAVNHANMCISSANNNNSNSCHNQNHQYGNILALNTTRHSVALAVPSSHGVLASTNLLVAGAMSENTSLPSTSVAAVAATTPLEMPSISPLLLAGTGGSVSASTVSPPKLHHQHHILHTPTGLVSSVAVSVPILTHHHHNHLELSYHLQQVRTNLKNHYSSHQYHHLSHLQPQQQHQQSSDCSFMPSASLPVFSAVPTACTVAQPAAPATTTTTTFTTALLTDTSVSKNRTADVDELRDFRTGNRYIHQHDYVNNNVNSASSMKNVCEDVGLKGFQQYDNNVQNLYIQQADARTSFSTIAPIDLSLGRSRRISPNSAEKMQYINSMSVDSGAARLSVPLMAVMPSYECRNTISAEHSTTFEESRIVDLTYRKRKSLTENLRAVEDSNPPEKFAKLFSELKQSDEIYHDALPVKLESSDHDADTEADDNDEVDVEVEKTQPIKPVKLFKPYLLYEEDDITNENKIHTAHGTYKQKDPIIWSHHPTCVSPNSYDSRQGSSQSPPTETHPFPAGNFSFPIDNRKSSATVLRCPKGSPVSGYESSSSTYSDSSFSGEHYREGTYSLNLKMHPIDISSEYYNGMISSEKPKFCHIYTPTQNSVQKWLDQDSTSTTTNNISQNVSFYH